MLWTYPNKFLGSYESTKPLLLVLHHINFFSLRGICNILKLDATFWWAKLRCTENHNKVRFIFDFRRQQGKESVYFGTLWKTGKLNSRCRRHKCIKENWNELTFSKDFWDCSSNRGKKWPIADRCVSNNNPRNNRGMHSRSSFLLVSKVAHAYSYQTLDCNFGWTMTGVFATFKVFFIV